MIKSIALIETLLLGSSLMAAEYHVSPFGSNGIKGTARAGETLAANATTPTWKIPTGARQTLTIQNGRTQSPRRRFCAGGFGSRLSRNRTVQTLQREDAFGFVDRGSRQPEAAGDLAQGLAAGLEGAERSQTGQQLPGRSTLQAMNSGLRHHCGTTPGALPTAARAAALDTSDRCPDDRDG